MASKTHMKKNSSQTERISLIAEILLEGALRLMEKHNDKTAKSNPTELRKHSRKIDDASQTISQVHVHS